MMPEEKIDAALDLVLRAAGSALRHHTMPLTLDRMRTAMQKIMADSYLAGEEAARESMFKTPS